MPGRVTKPPPHTPTLHLLTGLLTLSTAATLSTCAPPQIGYPYTELVTERRVTLYENLLELLPENQRQLPEAQAEAQWLSDTAYKAAAGISRINNSHFPGWAGNSLVNMHFQERGLCWHYQHDMYRELRRRPLNFFRIGCCVRDCGDASEHNCVYIAPISEPWPKAWVLDAWKWNGRLSVDAAWELNLKRWEDRPAIVSLLCNYYTEGHQHPIEHWYSVRTSGNKYDLITNPGGRESDQYRYMMNNIEQGKKQHPGSPVNY